MTEDLSLHCGPLFSSSGLRFACPARSRLFQRLKRSQSLRPSSTELSSAQRLFPLQDILDAPDGVLNLALHLVGLAFRFQLGVTDRLTDRLLHRAFDFLRRSDDPVLIHDFFLQFQTKT